jgi:solute carrier family 25 S-adenosylmethionine transporter 26
MSRSALYWYCSLLLTASVVVEGFQSAHILTGVKYRRNEGNLDPSVRPLFSKIIGGDEFLEDLDAVEEVTMSRRLFFSQSLSAAVAVSVMATNPVDAIGAESKQFPSQLASASKITDETLIETISGFFSGAALTTTKTFVKYPLDTATVRLQMPGTKYSIFNLLELFDGSFRGISLPLLSNIPGGAVFFAIKDATKSVCKQSGLPKWLSTCISVGVANFPYWFIRNPSEVLKTRQQVSTGDETAFDALQAVFAAGNTTDGFKDLYSGYWENIIYAYPADVIKFLAYEKFSSGKKNLPPAEAAIYGAASTAVAQFTTTPLDVVRNRIMAGKSDGEGGDKDGEDLSYFDRFARIGREEGLKGLFAGASPRVGKAFLSGAIQFATYEETKKSIREAFGSTVGK